MKRYVIRLSEVERNRLTAVVSKGKAAASKRLHAQVLLKADVSAAGPGWTDRRIIEALGVGERTVQAIRQRCVEEGLDAALERKKQCRPSRQRVLDGAQEAQLVALCCGKVPAGQARWTLRLLAGELVRLEIVDSVSHETVRQALKKTS
jgi:transposase